MNKLTTSYEQDFYAELNESYLDAILDAANDTGMPQANFPSACPYTIEQLLDNGFYPD